jgi:hypothetical protein
MSLLFTSRRGARVALAIGVAIIGWPLMAGAQGVGSGPLTATLAETEPEAGVIKAGPVSIAPGLTIREMGHDDNVFDEAEDPKEDWVIAGTPDVAVFTRLRFAKISAYAGSEMQYYHRYESERAVGHNLRGRVDFLLSRISPFIGGGSTRNRVRPNGEIDVRADTHTDELSGGLAYDLSPSSLIYASAIQTNNEVLDAFQSGVNLQQSLTRQGTQYQAGLRTELTPLLTMTVSAAQQEDEFKFEPLRNGESRNATVAFRFDSAAVISGGASIGYTDYRPVDPLVKSYRGVVGAGFITYPFLEIGRFNFGYNRSTEYSFDFAEAYYLQNSVTLVYTHRLVGEVDVQGQATRSFFDYGNRVGSAERRDSLESYNGNVGYNLRNRTRISANYEYARRRSPEIASRNYIRRRVYLSWMVAF